MTKKNDLKETIFINEENYQELFKDKEYCPILKNNHQEYSNKLLNIGITNIKALDSIEITSIQEELTLLILPINEVSINNLEEDDGATKHITLINHYDELVKTENLYYLRNKNLIIARKNIFSKISYWEEFYTELHQIDAKRIPKEELELEKIKNLFKKKLNENIKNLKEKIKIGENDEEYEKNKYLKIIRETEELKEQLKALNKNSENLEEKFENNLKELNNLPMIKDIQVKDCLEITLTPVIIKENLRVGEEKDEEGIEIPIIEERKIVFNDLTFYLTATNIRVSSKEKGFNFPHPHVQSDGAPCFGEAKTEIYKQLELFNLKKLLSLLYSWAISYNPNSCYNKLENYLEE
jgi:hypothetical protein